MVVLLFFPFAGIQFPLSWKESAVGQRREDQINQAQTVNLWESGAHSLVLLLNRPTGIECVAFFALERKLVNDLFSMLDS